MRTATIAAAVITLALLTGATAAQATPTTRPGGDLGNGRLIRQHDCVSMNRPITPPIAGYLIRDTAQRSGRLFYRGSGTLTSGLFVSHGGTWELRYQCRR